MHLDCSRSCNVFSTSSDRWSDRWRCDMPVRRTEATAQHGPNIRSISRLFPLKDGTHLAGCSSWGSGSYGGKGMSMSGSRQHPACSLLSWWRSQHWNGRGDNDPSETPPAAARTGTSWRNPIKKKQSGLFLLLYSHCFKARSDWGLSTFLEPWHMITQRPSSSSIGLFALPTIWRTSYMG